MVRGTNSASTIVTIPEALQLALQHHQAGRLGEAENFYRQILAVQPQHADALHLLGVIAHQVGQHGSALDLIRRAIALVPNQPVWHSNLGEAFRALGQFDEAIAAYRRALALQPDYAEFHSNLGNALRDKGWLVEATAAFRRAVQCKPDYAEAHNNLGAILSEQGLFEDAIAAYREALRFKPDYAEARNNLGNALRDQGRIEEAIPCYREALILKPDYAEACNNLANVLRDQGQLDEAIAEYHRAIQLKPDYAEAHSNLGNAWRDKGEFDQAIAACRRAIQLQPDSAEAHSNLGNALRDRGQLEGAIAEYHRAIQLQPDDAIAHNNLGNALRDRGQLDEGIIACRRAIQLQPDYAEAHSNLGVALNEKGQFDEGLAACRRALELKPDVAELHYNPGVVLSGHGQFDAAIAAYRRAIQIRPDYAEAHCNLGNALKDQAQLSEAMECYRRAVALKPEEPRLHSNLLYAALFDPTYDWRLLQPECARWDQHHGAPPERGIQAHANIADPERRLRVGYVSPDFFRHVISHFLTPLLEAHDHAAFEIFCYASVKRPDQTTERQRKTAEVWRDVLGVSDEALAAQIREDRIDILVDLTQHMADNRMPVFARKPAPVQVAWVGYPGSTGLRAMDWRLTDAQMEPEGSPWSESVEKVARLPDSWFCFDPMDEFPEPGGLPALRAGHVTFGCLNNFCKVSDAVLERWAAVLHEVPGSRLLLRCPEGSAQTRVREFFAERGIAAERIELVAWSATRAEFLELFQRIDLALDPFPYNGGTTTCEALWMGVPVLTLPGERIVSRIGLSILSACGMSEFVAHSEAEYVRLAASLAADLSRLAHLRATLRARMKASAFMDAPRFAKNVEHAYRAMWRAWCAEQTVHPTP